MKCFPVYILTHINKFVVVQSCAPDPGIVEDESKGANQVQSNPGVGAQPDDVSGVGGYLRLI
jgi:hypothetical protein